MERGRDTDRRTDRQTDRQTDRGGVTSTLRSRGGEGVYFTRIQGHTEGGGLK